MRTSSIIVRAGAEGGVGIEKATVPYLNTLTFEK